MKSPLSPSLNRALKKFGRDIKEARFRRRVTAAIVAERANITTTTLTRIERGEPSVSFGAYASVLFSLGLIERLYECLNVRTDTVEAVLAHERSTKRVRLSKKERGLV